MKIFPDYPDNRLFSLDCLRGLDMLLLTVLTPIVVGLDRSWALPKSLMVHCHHIWGALTLHDVIMPCFIFMCGAAIPFSLARRLKDGKPTGDFWWHLAKRFALLYFLGSIAQCNLLSFDPMEIHVLYNTLQVIGIAYVTTALVMLIPSRAVQVAMPVLFAATMGVVVHLYGNGDYTQEGNFAYRFDRIFWGIFLPAGQHSLKPNGYFSYLLPQLACSALTMCGYECALVLKSARKEWTKAGVLTGLAVALFASAWLVSFKVPVIKHIYSLSFTLYTCAWSVLALAVLYVVTDIWRFRRGTGLVILFGQTALAAYMLKSLFGRAFETAAGRLVYGVPHLFGDKALPFATALAAAVLLTLTVVGWSVYKRFRKLPEGK